MKNIFRILMTSFFVAIFIAFMVSSSFAQIQPKVKAPVDTKELQKPIPIPLPDLIVTNIYGDSCPNCGCGRTNFQNHPLVEYQEGIRVYVRNQGRAASGACTLKIELYDVIGGRMAVINKNVPGLEAGGGTIIVESGEFLYRKSSGIKATIDSTNVVNESNERNNSKTVYECVMEGPI